MRTEEMMPTIIEKLLKIIELDEKIFKIYVDRLHTPNTTPYRRAMREHSLMEEDRELRRERKSIKLSLRGDIRRLNEVR